VVKTKARGNRIRVGQLIKVFRDRATKKGAGGAGGLWANGLSEENREQRRKQWLNLASPEERALVDVYFEMLAQQGGRVVGII